MRRRRSSKASWRRALPVLVGCAACGGSGDAHALAGLDALPRYVLREELRIGSVEDPEVGFSDIAQVSVAPDGTVHVLERQDREVRTYSPEGVLLRTVGGPGDGPGELQLREGGVVGFLGDTLWVIDRPVNRITFFGAAGEVLGTLTLPPVTLPGPPGYGITLLAGAVREDGLVSSSPRIGIPPAVNRPTDVTLDVPTVRFDRNGRIVDTLHVRPMTIGGANRRITLHGQDLIVPAPPVDEPIWTSDGGTDDVWVIERRAAASAGDAFVTVTRMVGSADTVWHRVLSYAPRPFTDAMIDALAEQMIGFHVTVVQRAQPGPDSAAVAAAAREALRAEVQLPPFVAPVTAARIGSDDVLWLRRDGGGTGETWAMIGADGEPVGEVGIPSGVTVHWSDGETVWASRLDEIQVPWLVRYRLVRENGPQ